jgi:2-aminoadipate transaminase
VVEAPTYLGGIMAFQSFEADVVGIALDEDGLRVDELEQALANGLRPKIVYSIPDHQNPAGVSLSSERREALVDLARRFGFLVVEDVAYRELSFEEQTPPSLWSLAPEAVIQAGTFSKTFFPGVRLGWATGPGDILAKLVWAKQNTDQCSGALGQRLLEEYGRRGHLDEQVRRSRSLYRSRCAALLKALDTHLAGRASWTRPRGGFFTWLDIGVDADDIARRALAAGVGVVPGRPFFADGSGAGHLRLAFSSAAEEEMDEGVRRLATLL